MTREHTQHTVQARWPAGERAYTVITPAVPYTTLGGAQTGLTTSALATEQPDEARLLMVQGLRLLAGVWDDAASPTWALRCMESLGMRAITLDDQLDAAPVAQGEPGTRGAGKGQYDIALALHTPATRTALLHRVWAARQALRPGGALALATTVASATGAGADLRGATTTGAALPGDDTASALNLTTVRGVLATAGFIAHVFAWQVAPTLAELAPICHTLPTPRRLLVIASLGDDAETQRIHLRSA